MPKYTQQQLEEQYQKLPDNLKEAIFSVDIAEKMWSIGRKHGITIQRTGDLAEEAGYLILGLTHPKDFIPAIETRLGLDDEEAGEIGKEINEQVFLPIRQALKQAHDTELDHIENEAKRRLANYHELSNTKLADIFPKNEPSGSKPVSAAPAPTPEKAPAPIQVKPLEKSSDQKIESPIKKDFSFSDLAKMPSSIQSPLEKKITDINPPKPAEPVSAQPIATPVPRYPDPGKLRPSSGRPPFIPQTAPQQSQNPAKTDFTKVPSPTATKPPEPLSDIKPKPEPKPFNENQSKELQEKISTILSELPAETPKKEEKKISFDFPEEISAPTKEVSKETTVLQPKPVPAAQAQTRPAENKPVVSTGKMEGINIKPVQEERRDAASLDKKPDNTPVSISPVKTPAQITTKPAEPTPEKPASTVKPEIFREKPESLGGVLMSAPIAKKEPPMMQTAPTQPAPAIKPAPPDPVSTLPNPYKGTDPYREPIE